MAKSKFEALDDFNMADIQSDAPLKENTSVKKKKNQMVYGIDVELAEAVKARGESLSSFLKRAGIRIAKEEGII